jgi:AraC-like DNA-binding protein
MLASTKKTVAEVALSVGFGNQGHFCVAFKRAFGVAPTRFRKSHAPDA